MNGNLSATGVVAGSSFNIGSSLFAFGSLANQDVSLGFGGNSAMTGTDNTAVGYEALQLNTTGLNNTATGALALLSNTGDSLGDGSYNTANGYQALSNNTLGNQNTATSALALFSNTGGSNGSSSQNTADGYQALVKPHRLGAQSRSRPGSPSAGSWRRALVPRKSPIKGYPYVWCGRSVTSVAGR